MRGQQNSISCRLGRRPVKEGLLHQLKVQGWVDKSASRPIKAMKGKLTIGTWNIRTLYAAGKLDVLKEKMKNYQWDILGLNEARWTKSGEINGVGMIWAGHEERHENGVGFLLRQKARRSLLGYNPVSPRVIAARFSAMPFSITVIQVCAPTSMSTDEGIYNFYGKLEVLNDSQKKDIKVMMGDWNAKVVSNRKGWETIILDMERETNEVEGCLILHCNIIYIKYIYIYM